MSENERIIATQNWVLENVVQSDWNTNDENDLSYVKNRTHWEKEKKEVILDRTVDLTSAESDDNGVFFFGFEENAFQIEHDVKYIVNWSGVEYICKGIHCIKQFFNGEYHYYDYIGNVALAPIYYNYKYENISSNEPFYIGYEHQFERGDYWVLGTKENSIHHITITKITNEIHTIDNKYLDIEYNDIKNTLVYEKNNYKKIFDYHDFMIGSSSTGPDQNGEYYWFGYELDTVNTPRLPIMKMGTEYLVEYPGKQEILSPINTNNDEYPEPTLFVGVEGEDLSTAKISFGFQWYTRYEWLSLLKSYCEDPNFYFRVYEPTYDLKQLDEKFIPDTIARTTEIPSIDGLASKNYVDTKVSELVNSAPETLNTLNELATALGNDPNFATTISNQIGTKASSSDLTSHIENKSNPHNVTTTQIGAMSANNPVGTGSFSMDRRGNIGEKSFAAGHEVSASGDYSHAEGYSTIASGESTHAEGRATRAIGEQSHAEGQNTIANGNRSHAEGGSTIAFGNYSHAEGEGYFTSIKLSGDAFSTTYNITGTIDEKIQVGSIVTDNNRKVVATIMAIDKENLTVTLSTFISSEALNEKTCWVYCNGIASGDCSHTEGQSTIASGLRSHAEGRTTVASGHDSHAEGTNTIASSSSSHAEGNNTKASGMISHAEGNVTKASGKYSHAEGSNTEASGESTHAEGNTTKASGKYSHAEGERTEAIGKHSHAEGNNTIASSDCQHVQGQCNITDNENKYIHIVGNGYVDESINAWMPSNAHTLDWQGNAWYSGDVYVGSTSGTNKDEGSKKLATEEYVDNALSNGSAPDASGQIEEHNTSSSAHNDIRSSVSNALNEAKSYTDSTLDTAKTYTNTKVAELVNSAPETLDTLGEVAAAIKANETVVDALNSAIGNKVDKIDGKGLSTNDYTTAEKNKLAGIEAGANAYSLPTASSSTLGGVKIGTGIGISSGVISNSGVRSISTGSTNGTISVNTNGTSAEVAVKGLGSNAYSSTAYLPLAGGTVTGVTTFSNTTASSSTTTGAVKISGGLGVAGNIYGTKVYGAVWNDYAEYRSQNEKIDAGYIVYCDDDGKLKLTTERLQKFEGVVSDTFGFAIGETDECQTPIAVSGRVLVYCNPEEHFHSGDCVCAGPDGLAYYMTREEIMEYPDRIVGIVSEIPTYEVWGSNNIKVNNRIWIRVR